MVTADLIWLKNRNTANVGALCDFYAMGLLEKKSVLGRMSIRKVAKTSLCVNPVTKTDYPAYDKTYVKTTGPGTLMLKGKQHAFR